VKNHKQKKQLFSKIKKIMEMILQMKSHKQKKITFREEVKELEEMEL
jgi:hypothetical protein